MIKIIKYFEEIFAVIGGFIGFFIGGFNGLIYALLSFMIIDYITGLTIGILTKKLSSKIGFKGIFKKVIILVLVGVANIIDNQILKSGNALRTATIFFYIANEGISILENAATIGLPVPKKLTNVLEQLNQEKENDDAL